MEPHKVLSPLPKQRPAGQMLVKTKTFTKRLSDVSSLSAGSSGYQADTSSIGTGSRSSSKRLSDVSGLTKGSSKGGSSGYEADTSSIGTGSGSSSKRDRLR